MQSALLPAVDIRAVYQGRTRKSHMEGRAIWDGEMAMKCQGCGLENVNEAKFCRGCGALMPQPRQEPQQTPQLYPSYGPMPPAYQQMPSQGYDAPSKAPIFGNLAARRAGVRRLSAPRRTAGYLFLAIALVLMIALMVYNQDNSSFDPYKTHEQAEEEFRNAIILAVLGGVFFLLSTIALYVPKEKRGSTAAAAPQWTTFAATPPAEYPVGPTLQPLPPQVIYCRECGSRIQSGYGFCNNCGARV